MDRERVLPRQTVIVRDGIIVSIGSSARTRIPAGARRIEGKGRFLLPGLIDSHVHLRDTTELLSYLAFGVTSVIHLSGGTGNLPNLLDLRRRVAVGEILGPAIFASGSLLDGAPPIFPSVSTVVADSAAAQRVVEAQVASGVDFIKLYNNLSSASTRSAIAAAHARGRAVFGHIPRIDGRGDALQVALSAGIDVIAHGEEYFFTYFYPEIERQIKAGRQISPDPGGIPNVVGLTKQAGAAVTPNLSFIEMTRAQLDNFGAVLSDPEARYLSPSVREQWATQNPSRRRDLELFDRREQAKLPFVRALTLALSRASVPLFLGSDASAPGLYPGKSAQLELQALVRAGLTPFQAIVAGTREPGEFLRARASAAPRGVVRVGSRADLILVRRNPLADIRAAAEIDGVMVAGRWLTSTEIAVRRQAAVRE